MKIQFDPKPKREDDGERYVAVSVGGSILGASLAGPIGAILGALVGILVFRIAERRQKTPLERWNEQIDKASRILANVHNEADDLLLYNLTSEEYRPFDLFDQIHYLRRYCRRAWESQEDKEE